MKHIIVVGGGLAGMAAAEQAARNGARVTILEWRRVLGGRAAAYSIKLPAKNRVTVDNGQHIILGCCTESLALFERLGIKTCFTRRDGILFASPADFGKNSPRRWKFSASPLLPTKLQFAPAFFKNPFLSFGDRVQIALVARRLGGRRNLLKNSSPNDISFAAWAESQRLSKKSLAVFWQPFILSVLCETLENVSISAVQKVVRQGLFGGRDALAMYIPNQSLHEIFNNRAGDALRAQKVEIIFGERVESFNADENEVTLRARSGNEWNADAAIFAIPPSSLWGVMHNAQIAEEVMSGFGFDGFCDAAITTIHLWATRRILPAGEDVCALLGDFRNDNFQDDFNRGGQMVFVPPRDADNDAGILHTVVISAAHRLLNEEELASSGHEKLIARVIEQLRQTFPEAFSETFADSASPIRYAKVTTVLDAVQSPKVKNSHNILTSEEKIPRVAFAGDWRCDDFPNTFESAVRSGINAVESLGLQH